MEADLGSHKLEAGQTFLRKNIRRMKLNGFLVFRLLIFLVFDLFLVVVVVVVSLSMSMSMSMSMSSSLSFS